MEKIQINRKGQIVNGHHRFFALIEAGKLPDFEIKDDELDYDLDIAGQLLSGDSENTIEEMVELIRNHPDENEIIDYIDGVNPWKNVEFCFTAKQFMFEISKPNRVV